MSRLGPWAGRNLAIAAFAAVLAALCSPAAARPYTVEDLVHQESFGQVAFDPSGRWLAYEHRVARVDAPSFPSMARHEVFENRLRLVDLLQPPQVRPLIASDPVGVNLGPFSPDGRLVAVYGLRRGRWQLGVVTLATRRLRWLDIDPEFPFRNRTVQWRGPGQLVAIDRPRESLPLVMKLSDGARRELPGRWAATQRGEVSVTAIGAGRYFGLRPKKPPSRMVLADVASGRVTTLATGDIEDLEVAPDGRHIAFTEAGADIRLAADQPVQGPNGTAWHHERLGIVDLADHHVLHPCPDQDVSGELLSWSASGRRLLAFARPDGAPLSAGRLATVSSEGQMEVLALGDAKPVLHERPEGARAAWLGEVPAVLVRRAGRQDWIAVMDGGTRVLTEGLDAVPDNLQPVGDSAIGVANGHAWRFTATGATPLKVGDDVRAMPTSPFWEARLGSNPPVTVEQVTLQSTNGGVAQLSAVSPVATSAAVRLPDTSFRVQAAAPGRGEFAAISVDARGVTRLNLRVGSVWTLLDAANLRQRDVDPLRAIPVRTSAPASGGAPGGWLYLPAPGAVGAAPPLVIVPYPGQRRAAPSTLADYGESYMTPSIPVLLGAGYAVLVPSLPLSQGEEPSVGVGAKVLEVVDAAAAQYPGAFDSRRLALWGHSLGGYGVVAIITQTNRIRAAIEMAGPMDMVGMWGSFQASARVDSSEGTGISGEIGWAEDSQGAMGGPPWRNPARYVRDTLVFHADRIHTPLLIIQGDQDHVPMAQGEEIFSALFRQDRDAVLLTYWGEEHILYSPGNVRDAYRRGLAWLADNLDRPVKVAVATPAESPEPGSATTSPSSR
ncbi:prolyl oligopeptidase family serine peptidase [Phenylobacterium sp.]|uniref:S9 family peptidase n=1 Tax=Phenylobacterium sp. TaxID=1871053 RepID=UPI003562AC74